MWIRSEVKTGDMSVREWDWWIDLRESGPKNRCGYRRESRCYGVAATISRLLKMIGLLCKRALQKSLYSAKETCHFKEPTNCSHPIVPLEKVQDRRSGILGPKLCDSRRQWMSCGLWLHQDLTTYSRFLESTVCCTAAHCSPIQHTATTLQQHCNTISESTKNPLNPCWHHSDIKWQVFKASGQVSKAKEGAMHPWVCAMHPFICAMHSWVCGVSDAFMSLWSLWRIHECGVFVQCIHGCVVLLIVYVQEWNIGNWCHMAWTT